MEFLGWRDLIDGGRYWRLCYLLATADMRRRFARSRLGQFWIMLSSAIYISAIGVVWSQLWHQPPQEILPFVAIGMMVWQLISSIIIEATTALQSSSNYFLNQYTSTSAILYAVIYRNLVIFLLNMIFPVLICLGFGIKFTSNTLMSVVGLLLLLIHLHLDNFGPRHHLCTVSQTLFRSCRSVVQIIFFLTPPCCGEA